MEFGSRVTRVDLPGIPFALDLSNDGSRLAVALLPGDEDTPAVQVYDTADGGLVGEVKDAWGGRGVAFTGVGERLHLLLEDEDGYWLARCRADGSEMEELATLPLESICHALPRDGKGRHVAVCGTFVEVWDVEEGRALARRDGAVEGEWAHAAFVPDGSGIWTQGIVASHLVLHDPATLGESRRLPAPDEMGGQVAVAPSGAYVAARGSGLMGTFLYDAATGSRLHETRFDDKRYGGRVAFSSDGKAIITLMGNAISANSLADGTFHKGPRFGHEEDAAIASALESPLVALAWNDGHLCWLEVRG